MCYLQEFWSVKSLPVGFWGFCPKNESKTPLNVPKKALFGLIWFGNALVMILDQILYSETQKASQNVQNNQAKKFPFE